jgi:hypothetical protein
MRNHRQLTDFRTDQRLPGYGYQPHFFSRLAQSVRDTGDMADGTSYGYSEV